MTSRRKFIITASAAAAGSIILNACTSSNNNSAETPSGGAGTTAKPAANVTASANAPKVETNKVKLGFIPLTDSAPLIIAKEKGLFAKYGMGEVELVKQKSWAVTRDNLKIGSAGSYS